MDPHNLKDKCCLYFVDGKLSYGNIGSDLYCKNKVNVNNCDNHY